MGNTPVVSLQHAQKAFGNNAVLKDISLTVEQGDVLSIIGPSGGGKSTLLRCMTLLETLDAGSLSYGDLQVVTASEAKGKAVYGGKDVLAQAKKRYGLVFQNFNLFPHYTVLQNVTDALICVQKKPKEEALAKGRELLAKMGLTGKEDMVPCELSVVNSNAWLSRALWHSIPMCCSSMSLPRHLTLSLLRKCFVLFEN